MGGEYVVVEQISHELLEEPEVTYNFEVEGFHTYYVGESAVLVHNLCNKVIGQNGNMRVDLELGGSGKYNLHLHVGNEKYMFNGTDGFYGAGRFNSSTFVKQAIKKALEYLAKVGGSL